MGRLHQRNQPDQLRMVHSSLPLSGHGLDMNNRNNGKSRKQRSYAAAARENASGSLHTQPYI